MRIACLWFALSAVATAAVPALAADPDPASDRVAAVLGALADPDPEVRVEAAGELSRLTAEAWALDLDRVMPALLAALEDPETTVRRHAAVAIFQGTWLTWGPAEVDPGRPAIPEGNRAWLTATAGLVAAGLDDPDPIVREYLLRALATWMPKPPAELAKALAGRIADPERPVAELALLALGRTGEATDAVVAALAAPLADRPELTAASARALGLLFAAPEPGTAGPEARAKASAALAPLLDASDPEIRRTAARSITQVGAAGPSAAARLRALADDPGEDARVREAARTALDRLGDG